MGKKVKTTTSWTVALPYGEIDESQIATTDFTLEVGIDSAEDFDSARFRESVAESSGVNLGEVDIVSTTFALEASHTFTESVTEAEATTSIADANAVPENAVKVTMGRRLGQLSQRGRRLATSVTAVITVSNQAKTVSVQQSMADKGKLEQALRDVGKIGSVTVESAPAVKVTTITTIKSYDGTPPDAPDAKAVAGSIGDGGATVLSSSSPSEGPNGDSETSGATRGGPAVVVMSMASVLVGIFWCK